MKLIPTHRDNGLKALRGGSEDKFQFYLLKYDEINGDMAMKIKKFFCDKLKSTNREMKK